MDKRSKLLLVFFFTAIVAAVAFSLYRYFVLRDYYLEIEVACDPAVDACYIAECDPAEDETCPENPDERVSYYKIIEKKAYAIPACLEGEDCLEPACAEREEDCTETICDPAVDGIEACSLPVPEETL